MVRLLFIVSVVVLSIWLISNHFDNGTTPNNFHTQVESIGHDRIVFIRSVENEMYLNGHTYQGDPEYGAVDIADDPLSPELSGTRWRTRKEGQFIRFKNLGFAIGDNRWLDGHANPEDAEYKVVELAPTFKEHYTGTRWLIEDTPDGLVFKNQGVDLFLGLKEENDDIGAALVDEPYLWEVIDFEDMPTDEDKFLNPVADNKADPWVLLHEGSYYHCYSRTNGIYVTKADSLHKLGIGKSYEVYSPEKGQPNSRNIWAPELHLINNKFYLYYTAGIPAHPKHENQRMYCASADNPLGPFQYEGQLRPPNSNHYAIDGTVLQHNNQLFFLWCGVTNTNKWVQRLYISGMSSPTELSTPKVMISEPIHWWEREYGLINEAPQILKKNGKVHIVYSANSTFSNNYCLGLLTWNGGPMLEKNSWDKHSTALFRNSNNHLGPFSPGHVSFTKSLDGTEDWLLYHTAQYGHSKKDLDSTKTRRWINIKKFEWTRDNVPVFGDPVFPFTPMKKPK